MLDLWSILEAARFLLFLGGQRRVVRDKRWLIVWNGKGRGGLTLSIRPSARCPDWISAVYHVPCGIAAGGLLFLSECIGGIFGCKEGFL